MNALRALMAEEELVQSTRETLAGAIYRTKPHSSARRAVCAHISTRSFTSWFVSARGVGSDSDAGTDTATDAMTLQTTATVGQTVYSLQVDLAMTADGAAIVKGSWEQVVD